MTLDLLGILPPTHTDPAQNKWQRCITAAVILSFGVSVAANGALGAAIYQAQLTTQQAEKDTTAAIADLSVTIMRRLDDADRGRDAAAAETIAVRLLMLRNRLCQARMRGSSAESDEWARQIAEALGKYQRLSGQTFPAFEACPP
jgi:hypothetical protein